MDIYVILGIDSIIIIICFPAQIVLLLASGNTLRLTFKCAFDMGHLFLYIWVLF